MVNKNEFGFKGWFDEEVGQLEKDPEYIAYGIMVDLAAQVARKLHDEGLKQKELAERLGKSQGWISRFMNVPTNFSIKKLVEIAVALGMELDISFKEGRSLSKKKDEVQVKNPKTGRYVKIDRSAGRIISHKKSAGKYKGVPVAGKRKG